MGKFSQCSFRCASPRPSCRRRSFSFFLICILFSSLPFPSALSFTRRPRPHRMASSSGWFRTLALALLAIFYVASSFATTTVDAQSDALLGRKLAKYQAMATKGKGMIELDSSSFEEVLSLPRNYSIVVLFTAISPEFQCVPCKYVFAEHARFLLSPQRTTSTTTLLNCIPFSPFYSTTQEL